MLTAFFNVVYVTVKVEFLFYGLFILCMSVEYCTIAIELPIIGSDKGISPLPSHRTVRESLPSHGSSCF